MKRFLPYVIFLFASLGLHRHLWIDLMSVNSSSSMQTSDGSITEFLNEIAYQKLISGENPFSRTEKIFHPFGVNYAMSDPGIASSSLFIFLRPILSIHKSMIVVLIIYLFLAQFMMYKLLRKLEFDDEIAILGAIMFGSMPFLSHRLMGHYTYIPVFFFPLTGWLWLRFVEETRGRHKVLLAIIGGLALTLLLYSNFYYFIMIGLAGFVLILWNLATRWKLTYNFVKENWKYLWLIMLAFIVMLSPWLVSVKEYWLFEKRTAVVGLGGSIHYGADLFNFITPSMYSPLHARIVSTVTGGIPKLGWYLELFRNSWDRFVYPGILIIIGYIYLVTSKQLHKRLKKALVPFWLSVGFAILSLGPFLKIMGNWSINLEGVAVVIPLPFLLLQYVPGLESLRVPSRFIPIAIFFATIVMAYLAQYLKNRLGKVKWLMLFVIMMMVLISDYYYVLPVGQSNAIPVQAYQEISEYDNNLAVLDIPFTVRDGFRYLGFVHAIYPMQGALIHNKPMMGGYFARVGEDVFAYYDQLTFLGYVADIIDKGNYSFMYGEPNEPVIYPYEFSIGEVQRELDFFEVGYIVLKKGEKYSDILASILLESGVEIVQEYETHVLYRREIGVHAFNELKFGSEGDYLHIVRGERDERGWYRSDADQEIQVFLKSESEAEIIILEVGSEENMEIEIYLNREIVETVMIESSEQLIKIETDKMNEGFNVILLRVRSETSNKSINLYNMRVE